MLDATDKRRGSHRKTVNVPITSGLLIRAARGFSCIFWGIPLSVVLFARGLDIRLLYGVRIPAYILGVLLMYTGVIFLQRLGPISPGWQTRVREALLVLLIEVYLAPFVYWWRQMPSVIYYVANVVGLILITAWGLYLVNRISGELAKIVHNTTFFIESQISGWLSVVFILVPTVQSVLTSITRAIEADALKYFDFSSLFRNTPKWIYAMALLPFTLSMAVTWKAKERCLEMLRASARHPVTTVAE